MEYYNVRQIVVNTNKKILTRRQKESIIPDTPTNPYFGIYDITRRKPAEFDGAERNLTFLIAEEQCALIGHGDRDEYSDDKYGDEKAGKNGSEPTPIACSKV